MAVNWQQLETQLGQQLVGGIKGLVDGAAADIQAYGAQIASEMVLALSSGDQSAVNELKAQLKLMAEMQRVQIAAERETFVLSLINVALNAATSGLLAAGANLGDINGA